MMRSVVLTITLCVAACAPTPPPLGVRVTEQGTACTVRANGAEWSVDALDQAALRVLAREHGRRLVLDTDPRTTYRCIGAAVFKLQVAGFHIVAVTLNGVPLPSH